MVSKLTDDEHKVGQMLAKFQKLTGAGRRSVQGLDILKSLTQNAMKLQHDLEYVVADVADQELQDRLRP